MPVDSFLYGKYHYLMDQKPFIQETGSALLPILRNLGLSEKESAIYLMLLEVGKATAATVSEQTGLKKGITYNALYELQKLGLIDVMHEGKVAYFVVLPPAALHTLAKRKKKETELMDQNLNHLSEQLNAQYKMAVGKPTVRYFEGEDGLRSVFEDIYGPKSEIVYGCLDVEGAGSEIGAYIMKDLIPLRVRNKVRAETILTNTDTARALQQNDHTQNRESALIDGTQYPLPAEIDIYGDKIAMLSFEKGDFVGLIIENKNFAETLRSLFTLAQKQAKQNQK